MAKGEVIRGGYYILQSVEIANMEIIVADNLDADKPYMTWRRSLDQPFGAESHLLPMFGSDYVTVFREFVRVQSALADSLALDQLYRGGPLDDYLLQFEDCVPDGLKADILGKVVAIKDGLLAPECRSRSHQLMLVTGGDGCSTKGWIDLPVFGSNLYSGEQERWRRMDILGVIADDTLPAWAREKLAALRAPAEKESVMDKIREARASARTGAHHQTTGKERSRHKKTFEQEV